jgi:hypothetical protein
MVCGSGAMMVSGGGAMMVNLYVMWMTSPHAKDFSEPFRVRLLACGYQLRDYDILSC